MKTQVVSGLVGVIGPPQLRRWDPDFGFERVSVRVLRSTEAEFIRELGWSFTVTGGVQVCADEIIYCVGEWTDMRQTASCLQCFLGLAV